MTGLWHHHLCRCALWACGRHGTSWTEWDHAEALRVKRYEMPLVKQGQTSGHKDKGQNGADEHAVSLLNADRRSMSLRDAKLVTTQRRWTQLVRNSVTELVLFCLEMLVFRDSPKWQASNFPISVTSCESDLCCLCPHWSLKWVAVT